MDKNQDLNFSCKYGVEKINWAELENEHMPKKYCPGCYKYKRKQEYHLCEWNKDKDRGNCNICIAGRIKDGRPFECNDCNEWFCAEAFEEHQRDHRSTHTRICIGCLERRLCIKCGEEKKRECFIRSEWEHARFSDGQGKCKMCCGRSSDGEWYCKGCHQKKDKIEFSQYIMTNGQKKNTQNYLY